MTDNEIIIDQLENALNEIKSNLTVEQGELIYDYVFEALRLAKKSSIPNVIEQDELLKFLNWYVKDEAIRDKPDRLSNIVHRYITYNT